MFMCNTCCAIHDLQKELKQQELTWKQLFAEVTVINDLEAQWDFSKKKEVQEGTCCPAPGNGGKRAKARKKKQDSVLLDCAEEF